MKLVFKFSLLILSALFGLLGVLGIYFIVDEGLNDAFELNFPFFALLSIPSFIYHLKTLTVYRTKATYTGVNLDEDFITSAASFPSISSYLWIFSTVLALQVFGCVVLLYANTAFDLDKIPSNRIPQLLTVFLIPTYYGIGTLADIWSMSRRIKREQQQEP